jgi:hypothetical protein
MTLSLLHAGYPDAIQAGCLRHERAFDRARALPHLLFAQRNRRAWTPAAR